MNNEGLHSMQSYRLERKGCQIHYWLTGEHSLPAKPVIIFTHGASLDHHMFDTQVPLLLEAGYPVLSWDVRGHGLSKPIGERFDVQTAVEDLQAIIDKHELGNIILVGHSFGGYVSQQLTFQDPERVAALAVIGCTDMTAQPSLVMRLAYRNMARLFRLIPDRKLRQQFAEGMGVTPQVRDYALRATNQLSREEFIYVMSKGVEPLYQDPGFGEGYSIPKPFLLTIGERDTAGNGVFLRTSSDWAKREPNCQYEIIPDAGHNTNQDNPNIFNPILIRFIDKAARHKNDPLP
ncbi:alpha/beta fold hydrolase [Paenibacillus sp. 1P07SE]|uniref:alpha/beta fold hydrolase n=1 Tax=Paenibacillus sp. 1P07SE TaxID=3132209 RepID=UPI0039A53614